MSTDRAQELIKLLNLQPHPEGGHFGEVFRSEHTVQTDDDRPSRCALTAIYFLLRRGEVSRLHRVLSDETWHHHEGGKLRLTLIDPKLSQRRDLVLGPPDAETQGIAVIPAAHWQMAEPLEDYTLISCCVGPGFDFADFALAADQPDVARAVGERWPDVAI